MYCGRSQIGAPSLHGYLLRPPSHIAYHLVLGFTDIRLSLHSCSSSFFHGMDSVRSCHSPVQKPSSVFFSWDTRLHKVPHDLPSVFMTSVKLLSFFPITHYTLALLLLLSQGKLVSTSGSLPVAIYLLCSSLPQRDLISNNHVP